MNNITWTVEEKQRIEDQHNQDVKAAFEGKLGKTVTIKRTRKIRPVFPKTIISSSSTEVRSLNYELIDILDEFSKFMVKRGEGHKAQAYQKAQESLILYPGTITRENYKDLKRLPGVGDTIIQKIAEYIETGHIGALEKERADPRNVFSEIYGVGYVKAKQLVEKGVRTIAELRERQYELLSKLQKVGLQYYEDILERIPRTEINVYNRDFGKVFQEIKGKGTENSTDDPKAQYEVVGSYRRGLKSSGDIDVILTSQSVDVFKQFIDTLVEDGTILEILARGPSKCLAIGRLSGAKHARRLDFLYCPPEEFPFAILYFTGSKYFNTVMRGRALSMGYSLNEHGLYHMSMVDSKMKKGAKVDRVFKTEQDIFAFLEMEYKEPAQRIDGRAVVPLSTSSIEKVVVEPLTPVKEPIEPPVKEPIEPPVKEPSPKNKTRKIRVSKEQKEAEKNVIKAEKEALKVKAKEEKEALKQAEKAEKLALKEIIKEEKQKAKTAKKRGPTPDNDETSILPLCPDKTPTKSAFTSDTANGYHALEKCKDVKKNIKNKTQKNKKVNFLEVMEEKTLNKPENTIIECPLPPPLDTGSPDPILHALQHFKTEGIKVLESMNEETLNAMLIRSNDAYYNVSTASNGQRVLLTDNEFDILKEHIQERFPKNQVVNDIGAPVQSKSKVTLPYNMPSMDKIKPDTGALTAWKQKYAGPYVISCKLDGVSGMYVVDEQGTKPKLYTRGNGTVGQDISHFIPYLNLPNEPGLVVRGEFIMKKAVFKEKYADQFANARNLVAGTINRSTVDERIHDIDFVTYEVIKPVLSPSKQMAKLVKTGFKTVQNATMADVTNESLSDILVKLRSEYEYEIDGIIVSHDKIHSRANGNPDYAFAFKMVLSDQMAEVKVLDVLWTASKDGYLKPRVQIEPVQLSGVKIEYATGFNGAFIEANRIGLGAVIQIIRSGDVIPHIRAVISPAEYPKMPSVAYKWNATHVDIMLKDKESDVTVREKNITGFFRGIEVDGLSGGNVSRIVGAGFDTVPKILKMSKADFLTIDGFKDKLATKIHDGIHEKVQEANLTTLMSASNLFGRGFSDKRIALALEEYPDILTSAESMADKIRKLSSVKGMAKKTAEAFVEAIPAFLGFLEECGLTGKVTTGSTSTSTSKGEQVDPSHPLYKKSIVMSGTRDKELEAALGRVGAGIGSSVSSKTFAVITPDVDGTTGKVATARSLNIKIMTPEEFKRVYLGK